jgi:uncharacterized protein
VANRLRRRSEVDAPVEALYDWHSRPGAFERLTPPWDRAVVERRTGGIEPGSRVVLRTPVGPLRGPLAPRWVAEHTDARPPHEFRDVQRSGPFAQWEHTHRFADLGEGRSSVTDDITYRLPLGRLGALVAGRAVRRRLERMFDYRHRITMADLAAHGRADTPMLHLAVTGATGLIGQSLVAFLQTGGHRVSRLTRGEPGPGEIRWDPARGQLQPDDLVDVDVVVHLAGEPIASRRWTQAQKQRIRDSRVAGTTLVARTLAALGPRADGSPRALVCASAIGYYGDRGEELLTEDSPPGDGFLAGVVRDWEAAADPAREGGVRVANVRIGIVQTPAGGALARLLPLFRAGVGGRFGSGRQWTSWVALDDVIGLLHHAAVTPGVEGPLNATAPQPLTNAEYTGVLARVLRRPALVPIPAFGPRLLLGEMADELLFTSARVLPERTLASGYRFAYPDLEAALRHLLGR